MKSAILFDLDGTLIDSTPAILESFAYAFEKFGLDVPPAQQILSLIGHPLDFMFIHLGVRDDPEPFVQSYKEHYHRIFKEKTTLLPGAREAVIEACGFAKLGIVTTKTGKYSKELMEHFGLMECFGVLIGREDVHHPKPHPEPVLKAMHHLGAQPEQTYMIGDTCLDAIAVKDAGATGVGVLCGYGQRRELERCFDHLRDDALAAVRFIKRINSYHR